VRSSRRKLTHRLSDVSLGEVESDHDAVRALSPWRGGESPQCDVECPTRVTSSTELGRNGLVGVEHELSEPLAP